MGSSKKKSSFRIDDLLQHQHEFDTHHTPTKRQMFSAPPTSAHKGMTAEQPQPPAKHRHIASSSAAATPSAPSHFHRSMPEMPSAEHSASVAHHPHHHLHQPPTATATSGTSKAPSLPQGVYADMPPHKPMPMYAPPPPPPSAMTASALLDMTKPNYCFPMPMAMPPNFSHAATAYLEHYANTFHKGEKLHHLSQPQSSCWRR